MTMSLLRGGIASGTKVVLYLLLIIVILGLSATVSSVAASYCQVTSASSNYPSQVVAGQKFSVSSTVKGFCSAGEDYSYYLRADVIDRSSGHVISSSRSQISSYNSSNFLVTLVDSVTAPAEPMQAWNIEISIALIVSTTIGPNDATGYLVRDYTRIDYATIQVGSTQPVPEFPLQTPSIVLPFALGSVFLLTFRRTRRKCA